VVNIKLVIKSHGGVKGTMSHLLWPDKVLGYYNFSVGLVRCFEM